MMEQRRNRADALAIWQAGVNAVDSTRLVESACVVTEETLIVGRERIPIAPTGKICVVGAGKAGAGMARGIENVLLPGFQDRLTGWINVPEDCVQKLESIHLHPARPAGINEPVQAGVEGTQRILQLVEALHENDLCIVLLSGGGSALLPAPVEGVTLEEKQRLTRSLMHNGATIEELNTIRTAISDVKGGGLLGACRAGRLVALIISDVIGDPPETIASGPTVDIPADPREALRLLRQFHERSSVDVPRSVWARLEANANNNVSSKRSVTCSYSNHIIGNNKTAVDAATKHAEKIGYSVIESIAGLAGVASNVGRDLANQCQQYRETAAGEQRLAIISGGEPTVQLAHTDRPRKGGRNQELVLAAADTLQKLSCTGITILSGGTDGEDGPTDAAGAVVDCAILEEAKRRSLRINDYLSINNSYPFFEQTGGLIKTGPTHTNVMDLRVALIETKIS